MKEDFEIVKDIQSGISGAFDRLIDKYKSRALQTAYSLLSSWDEADEVVQEAFIKVYKAINNFNFKSGFYTWFYKILINTCNDCLRRKAIRQKFFVINEQNIDEEGKAYDSFENYAATNKDARQNLIDSEIGKEIAKALYGLPHKQRLIFILKNIQGFKIVEIAEMTGLAEGTIKHQLFTAVDKLKQGLRGKL